MAYRKIAKNRLVLHFSFRFSKIIKKNTLLTNCHFDVQTCLQQSHNLFKFRISKHDQTREFK